MGYAVLHLEKAKGTDSRMSAHIERTVHPKNADRTRTHLNRELVQFPEGVRNRTQAIAHRIETAGIRRKVSANQVKAIRILLTGSNKDMKQMEAEGFGNCTNQYECEAACPKGISVDNIARLNRDFMRANAKEGLCF